MFPETQKRGLSVILCWLHLPEPEASLGSKVTSLTDEQRAEYAKQTVSSTTTNGREVSY